MYNIHVHMEIIRNQIFSSSNNIQKFTLAIMIIDDSTVCSTSLIQRKVDCE